MNTDKHRWISLLLNRITLCVCIIALLGCWLGAAHVQAQVSSGTFDGHFSIRSVEFHTKVPPHQMGTWVVPEELLPENSKSWRTLLTRFAPDGKAWEFKPCVEMEVETREDIRRDKTYARAYFFNERDEHVFTYSEPSLVHLLNPWKQLTPKQYSVIIKKKERYFFELPAELKDKKWKCIVVFGDENEAKAAIYPTTASMFALGFPEKALVEKFRMSKRVEREVAIDPLFEHVVTTRNADIPQITLIVRLPMDVKPSEVKGIMAICLVANSVDAVKLELQKKEMSGDFGAVLQFADRNNLAVLAWASRRVWNSSLNHDELEPVEARKINAALDAAADAWSGGVTEIAKKYGIPSNGIMLWGDSAAAQWAHRIALRKPEHFTALHIHMPSSFDKPVPEATNIWWSLTIGEYDVGFENSRKWYEEAKKAGFRIIYRPVPDMAHESDPTVREYTVGFFELALKHRDDPNRNDIFLNPEYYGNYSNQDVVPAAEKENIPAEFRISLPTKELAELWKNMKFTRKEEN